MVANSFWSSNKKQKKKQKWNFKSNNAEGYNLPFTMEKLNESWKNVQYTAVGPDDVHYQFMKQLPNKSLQVLLKFYNNIFGNFLYVETVIHHPNF